MSGCGATTRARFWQKRSSRTASDTSKTTQSARDSYQRRKLISILPLAEVRLSQCLFTSGAEAPRKSDSVQGPEGPCSLRYVLFFIDHKHISTAWMIGTIGQSL